MGNELKATIGKIVRTKFEETLFRFDSRQTHDKDFLDVVQPITHFCGVEVNQN